MAQALRPYPQFGNVYMMQATGAHSQYHAGIIQLRKRTTGVYGTEYTLKTINFDRGFVLVSSSTYIGD